MCTSQLHELPVHSPDGFFLHLLVSETNTPTLLPSLVWGSNHLMSNLRCFTAHAIALLHKGVQIFLWSFCWRGLCVLLSPSVCSRGIDWANKGPSSPTNLACFPVSNHTYQQLCQKWRWYAELSTRVVLMWLKNIHIVFLLFPWNVNTVVFGCFEHKMFFVSPTVVWSPYVKQFQG